MDDSAGECFQSLLSKFGLDCSLVDAAILAYHDMRSNYDLEGEPKIWVACALYEAYRNSVEPGPLSLTDILRCGDISLPDFFNKMKKWVEMSVGVCEFSEHVHGLERNFNVSMVIYKRYRDIFHDLFAISNIFKYPPHATFSYSELFDFSWLFYIQIKGSYSYLKDDLVHSYNLLLCCMDLVYANVVHAERKDLLNPFFPGVPAGFLDEVPGCVVQVSHPLSVLEELCARHDGVIQDTLDVNQHWFKPHVAKLAHEGALAIHRQTLLSLFHDQEAYYANINFLTTTYELRVQKNGVLDERVFTQEERASGERTGSLLEPRIFHQEVGGTVNSFPTPLTNRHFLSPPPSAAGTGGSHDSDLVVAAAERVARLHAIIEGLTPPRPSARLDKLFQECSALTGREVEERVQRLTTLFISKYLEDWPSDSRQQQERSLERQAEAAQCLYYKLLDVTLASELKRIKTNAEIYVYNLLHKDCFNRSLFACCLEIVLFSYRSKKLFPWVADALELFGFTFYRVIEAVVKHEEGFSRDVIKHLNWVEERCVEELSWQKDSPLWKDIEVARTSDRELGTGVPRCSDVLLPSQVENTSGYKSGAASAPPRMQKLPGADPTQGMRMVSATGQTLIPLGNGPAAVDDSGKVTLVPLRSLSGQSSSAVATKMALSDRPKRTGGLALFFRKVYLVGFVRLRELLHKMETPIDHTDEKKIWTVFEYCVTRKTHMFEDRHMDQILLCTVYIMGKVLGHEKWLFENMLRAYRLQPQAHSRVYRSVLVGISLHARGGVLEEERADIISFYNDVFVNQVLDFARQFSPLAGPAAGRLPHPWATPTPPPAFSVLPALKSKAHAARKISTNHNLYIMPHREQDRPSYGSTPRLSYRFSISPSKNLREMNEFIRNESRYDKQDSTIAPKLLKLDNHNPFDRVSSSSFSEMTR